MHQTSYVANNLLAINNANAIAVLKNARSFLFYQQKEEEEENEGGSS